MNEAHAQAPPHDWSNRVPGDPKYTRAMWMGEVPTSQARTARAEWERRQAALWNGVESAKRARIFLPILDALIAELGTARIGNWTVTELRAGLAGVAKEGAQP
jgi:hypothetical protein